MPTTTVSGNALSLKRNLNLFSQAIFPKAVTPITVVPVTAEISTGITVPAVTATIPTDPAVPAGHMLRLTAMAAPADQVVTDPADNNMAAVETVQVVVPVVTGQADNNMVATDQVVTSVTAQVARVISTVIVTATGNLKRKKSIRTRSRIRSRKPWRNSAVTLAVKT
jgi:hypothetical protein